MTQIKPILYSFRRCPYAMRARMALSYAQVDFELRDILLKNKPQSLLEYSPKATVPVLVLPEKILDESLEIMIWALRQQDCDGWLEAEDQKQLISLCDDKFKAQLDSYKYSARYEHSQEYYRREAIWFLNLLDDKLSKKNYLNGNQISLSDIAIFPFVRQFAFVDKIWFDSSSLLDLHHWLERNIKSNLFQKIMLKSSIWADT